MSGGTASVDDGSSTITWDEPTGGPVTDYDVQLRIFLGGAWSIWVDVTHVGTARTVTETLSNGQKYQFHVRGGNTAGEGEWSNPFPSNGVTPLAVVPVPGRFL